MIMSFGICFVCSTDGVFLPVKLPSNILITRFTCFTKMSSESYIFYVSANKIWINWKLDFRLNIQIEIILFKIRANICVCKINRYCSNKLKIYTFIITIEICFHLIRNLFNKLILLLIYSISIEAKGKADNQGEYTI